MILITTHQETQAKVGQGKEVLSGEDATCVHNQKLRGTEEHTIQYALLVLPDFVCTALLYSIQTVSLLLLQKKCLLKPLLQLLNDLDILLSTGYTFNTSLFHRNMNILFYFLFSIFIERVDIDLDDMAITYCQHFVDTHIHIMVHCISAQTCLIIHCWV